MRNQRSIVLWAGLLFGVLVIACSVQDLNKAPEGPENGWWQGFGPVVPHENFPGDCSLCHLGGDWKTLRPDFHFDHGMQTGVPLRGAHAQAQCLRCHNDRGPVQRFSEQGCAGCHADVHQGNLGGQCSNCHSEEHWRVSDAVKDHARTRFPLVGAHTGTACRQCHLGIEQGQMTPLDTACASCHRDLLASISEPDHLGRGWTSACDRCHRPTSWGSGGFTHTAFPLAGVHATIDCTQCHIGNVFAGTANTCFGCHSDEYAATSDPPHGRQVSRRVARSVTTPSTGTMPSLITHRSR
ncbi:MAG: cytochrome c3 family protein [Planctomycetota bacterium]